jgi:hypothetical protein
MIDTTLMIWWLSRGSPVVILACREGDDLVRALSQRLVVVRGVLAMNA